MYILIGIISFIFYYVYDFNIVYFKKKELDSCFTIGSLLLIISTVMMIYDGFGNIGRDSVKWIALSIFFAVMLVYTLFFALPFSETYLLENQEGSEKKSKVCSSGMYALCRHPGVLWLTGMYFALGAALGGGEYYISAFIFSLLDYIYVVLQDRIIFPQQFEDYEKYKEDTPFLIPNPESAVRAAGLNQK